jgi:aconitase B
VTLTDVGSMPCIADRYSSTVGMHPSFAAMAATHFRAVAQLLKDQSELPTELWVAPPTRMDEAQLKKEGVYQTSSVGSSDWSFNNCATALK